MKDLLKDMFQRIAKRVLSAEIDAIRCRPCLTKVRTLLSYTLNLPVPKWFARDNRKRRIEYSEFNAR